MSYTTKRAKILEEEVEDRKYKPKLMPQLKALGIEYEDLPGCTAPTQRSRQCRGVALYLSKITFEDENGRMTTEVHQTCWRHTEGPVIPKRVRDRMEKTFAKAFKR